MSSIATSYLIQRRHQPIHQLEENLDFGINLDPYFAFWVETFGRT
jgi:hypothetical protein